MLSYLERFDDSNAMFLTIYHIELAIEIRTNVGDFEYVTSFFRQIEVAYNDLKQ
jgi:hypothetical protein